VRVGAIYGREARGPKKPVKKRRVRRIGERRDITVYIKPDGIRTVPADNPRWRGRAISRAFDEKLAVRAVNEWAWFTEWENQMLRVIEKARGDKLRKLRESGMSWMTICVETGIPWPTMRRMAHKAGIIEPKTG